MADPGSARADLREAVERMRRPLDPRVLRAASDRAVDHLARVHAIQRARTVALHEPGEGDLDPRGLAPGVAANVEVTELRDGDPGPEGGTVAVEPAIEVGNIFKLGTRYSEPDPAEDDVRVVAAGRAHLVGAAEDEPSLDEVDVVVLPGIAFDLDGGRLGPVDDPWEAVLGQLAGDVLRVGLAHTTQLVPRVPRGDDDQLLDVVVTDRGVHHTGARMRPRDA